MITLRFDEVARLTSGTLREGQGEPGSFAGVSIDSRTINSGELFVAVRGERTDGHLYIPQAVEKGAAGIMIEPSHAQLPDLPTSVAVVEVEDSHEAMMRVAEEYRRTCQAKFIGITGSNGKTTTKELTAQLVGAVEKEVYHSPGNYNNLFGMPLALFAMPDDARVAVMEMGISVPGEMARLTRIVRPDVIVITNVGPSHLEFLGSVEGVARAKLEMVKESPPDVPVIINADNPVLVKETGRIRVDAITFGIYRDATFTPQSVDADPSGITKVVIEDNTFSLELFGRYQIYNLLAAYAAVKTLGYSFDAIDTRKIALRTAPMRGEKIVKNGITFIADCYNANPDSVKSGLVSFELHPSEGRRIIILGDMLELGKHEKEYHRDVGSLLMGVKFDRLVLVGRLAKHIIKGAVTAGADKRAMTHFGNVKECARQMQTELQPGDLVYVKGSRGVGLEAIINAFGDEGGEG